MNEEHFKKGEKGTKKERAEGEASEKKKGGEKRRTLVHRSSKYTSMESPS